MSGGKKFTRQQMLAALKATGGFICHSADLLGCNYCTVSRYLKDDPSLAEELQHIKENRLDIAESVVITTMEGEDVKEKMDAAKFYLRYKGRGRGYVKSEKLEIAAGNLSEMMRAAEKREEKL